MTDSVGVAKKSGQEVRAIQPLKPLRRHDLGKRVEAVVTILFVRASNVACGTKVEVLVRRRTGETMKSAEITHEQGWDFEQAAMPYVDSLYNTAYRMTRNSEDAEDLVQETYLKAYKYYDKFEEGTNFKAWLFKIMKNTFIHNYRRKQNAPALSDFADIEENFESQVSEEAARQIKNPEDELLENVLDEDVQRALDKLPPDYRMVVILA